MLAKYKHFIYPAGLVVLALSVFIYIFDAKIDINGDNCYYYAFATSLASGEGYCDVSGEASSLFPPGYPILMAPLRLITDSVVAQKVLNLSFLLASVLLLYYLLLAEGARRAVAFFACAAVLVTAHVLEFSTMMMSEPSCIFFVVLSLFAYAKLPVGGAVPWRSPWLYVLLFAVPYAFLIRTQAVVLFVAFMAVVLMSRRFKLALLLLAAFALCYAPWALRNSLLELGQSRYVSQIDFSNVWGNVGMLLVQALPESVIPFFAVNYAARPTTLLWVIATAMLAITIYGMWKMEKTGLLLMLLLVGNVGIVSIMNTPSLYRYTVIVLPVITVAFVTGLWRLFNALSQHMLKRSFSPLFLLLLFVQLIFKAGDTSKHSIYGLNAISKSAYPATLVRFIEAGKAASKRGDAQVVVSRKPELLYAHSGVKGKRYKEGRDNIQILCDLLNANADYVVLDNLGYKYTYEVLYPFLQDHMYLFEVVHSTEQPTTILFRFKKAEARRWLARGGYFVEQQ